ncbi:hypothetical protein [Streptomyces spiramyceticus]|nr:hypothetical protein [Streptomyces spiramyceticus]
MLDSPVGFEGVPAGAALFRGVLDALCLARSPGGALGLVVGE